MATRALEELRKAVSIQNLPPLPTDIFESLTSVLSLLTATPAKQPSEGFILSYQELFTKQIVVLYEAYPSLTLRLSSSIITENFKSRLSALLKAEKSKNTVNQISAWEGLLRSILNGVQTYIDGGKADMIEIGRTFYKPCFGMLGSPLGLNLSARIRTQTYSLLADTAAGCARNRELLRQKATLGGTRLGGIIASTNEYLVLDSLFQILARLTPSSSDVIGRADLAKDVFQNAKARKTFGKNTCDQLAAFLKDAKGDQWEKARTLHANCRVLYF
ncbi:hypothetical protein JB92DRAFT_1759238 [Gautieria morchelliformis]|nr:hypothetical protein JB92DRAFT_1759238 [Gautieria morchelliformis]